MDTNISIVCLRQRLAGGRIRSQGNYYCLPPAGVLHSQNKVIKCAARRECRDPRATTVATPRGVGVALASLDALQVSSTHQHPHPYPYLPIHQGARTGVHNQRWSLLRGRTAPRSHPRGALRRDYAVFRPRSDGDQAQRTPLTDATEQQKNRLCWRPPAH